MTQLQDATPTATPQLGALLDRLEISELIGRYVVSLDTAEEEGRDDDWYRGIFTDDVWLSFPIGERRGIDGLVEFHKRAKLAWEATLHVSGDHLVEVSGDRARARAQIIGTHVSLGASPFLVDPTRRFDMGGYYDVEAVRTDAGWRIAGLRFVLVWTSGDGTVQGGSHQR